MKSKLFSLLIILLISFSCSEDKEVQKPLPTIEDFKANLSAEMDYTSIVKIFGSPSKDIGSGIHIYIYPLPDGTEFWIGYSNKIHYARQYDAQGVLIFTLI